MQSCCILETTIRVKLGAIHTGDELVFELSGRIAIHFNGNHSVSSGLIPNHVDVSFVLEAKGKEIHRTEIFD